LRSGQAGSNFPKGKKEGKMICLATGKKREWFDPWTNSQKVGKVISTENNVETVKAGNETFTIDRKTGKIRLVK
jgi:hypothetical protein